MKHAFLYFAAACMAAVGGLTAASDAAKSGAKSGANDDVSMPDAGARAMTGTYVGSFGRHKITICLDRVIGETVSGYSIVAGNERAFSGSWNRSGDNDYSITAREPGDHPQDGVFKMTYSTKSKSVTGEWTANDKKIESVKFNLAARSFKYNPKAGKYPKSSTTVLKEKDVENMRPSELRIMRNEIYARHGYSFKLEDMREYFDALDWYMPMAVDITTKLTETEKKNAELIKRYEKYSEKYYDSFGR